jgi:streptomycin 6-kinase
MSDTGVFWESADEGTRAAKLSGYFRAWDLAPDGPAFATPSSWLAPVRLNGAPAMLKVPCHPEERNAMAALAWFGGEGAARVLRIDDFGVLMERLADDRPLKAMAEGSQDDEATRILAGAAMALHRPRDKAFPPSAPDLRTWFRALPRAARGEPTGLLQAGWQIAQALLDAPADPVLLHGDIHHENVLHDPVRGWAAIDPKGVVGPAGYDFANMLCNPLGALPLKPGRMGRQARIVAEVTGRSLQDILSWTVAYIALSTAWHVEDGSEQVANALDYCRVAQGELATARA